MCIFWHDLNFMYHNHSTLQCTRGQHITVIACENPLQEEMDPSTRHNLVLYGGQSVTSKGQKCDPMQGNTDISKWQHVVMTE